MTDKKHGGKREKAGRKPKWKEATVTVTFRVPASHEQAIRKMVTAHLASILETKLN